MAVSSAPTVAAQTKGNLDSDHEPHVTDYPHYSQALRHTSAACYTSLE